MTVAGRRPSTLPAGPGHTPPGARRGTGRARRPGWGPSGVGGDDGLRVGVPLDEPLRLRAEAGRRSAGGGQGAGPTAATVRSEMLKSEQMEGRIQMELGQNKNGTSVGKGNPIAPMYLRHC